MQDVHFDSLTISVDKSGAAEYEKVSYPVRYGRFHEIRTPAHIFQFNLNGEIKFVQGRGSDWPEPSEWLKRTVLDDWVYYSTGGYAGVLSFLGEYYLPNLSYASNSILGGSPFAQPEVRAALDAWRRLRRQLKRSARNGLPSRIEALLDRVVQNDVRKLKLNALAHQRIIGGRVSVLPPDCRHVDYEVIPVVIADGCLHNCGFCRVKSRQDFTARSRANINAQIENLKSFYGPDLQNYNSVFLGQHDALYADPDLLLFAARKAHADLGVACSNLKGPRLFMFGSTASFLTADDRLFERLDRVYERTYINIGLESADQKTLAEIRKPVEAGHVVAAFEKMLSINRRFAGIEVSANFLFCERFSERHYRLFLELVRDRLPRFYNKGAIYLSPWHVTDKIKARQMFCELKRFSRLPTYLYLIQRL